MRLFVTNATTKIAANDAEYLQSRYWNKNSSQTQMFNLLFEGIILYSTGTHLGIYFVLVLIAIRLPAFLCAYKQFVIGQAYCINVLCAHITESFDLNVRIGSALYWLPLLSSKIFLLYSIDIISFECCIVFLIYYIISVLVMAPIATKFNNYKNEK